MSAGTGFICLWDETDIGGIIHVCEGDNLVGDDVAFLFEDCSSDLQTILKSRNIAETPVCPPNSSTSLEVKFDFDFVNGMDLAIHVEIA